jgi:hypothetical protein
MASVAVPSQKSVTTGSSLARQLGAVPALDALLAETVDRQLAALAEALVAGWSPSHDAVIRR